MGVKPTPTNYKTFTFAGENSRNYGVYITGEGVFNAPERNVEMIDIPGRNGSYALDKGNFNNIEITYPAGIVADTEADFAEAVSDLRNLLCSQTGYVRLEDDYNPDEYRMAIYKSGLDVDHEGLLTGEFDITFECKPQRFLKSGETAVRAVSGRTVTNPTLFEAKPMLEVYGYGELEVGGAKIRVNNRVVGNIVVSNGTAESPDLSATITIDDTFANSGDLITFEQNSLLWEPLIKYGEGSVLKSISGTINVVGTGTTASGSITNIDKWRLKNTINLDSNQTLSFAYGTAKTVSANATATYSVTGVGTTTGTYTVQLAYDGNKTFTLSHTYSFSNQNITMYGGRTYIGTVWLDSTKSTLGTPTYIDLDIGEAYMTKNNSAVSLNNAVELPAELPTLPPGATTITFNNTFTKVDVVPRWWRV